MHKVAKRLVDQALSGDSGQANEGFALDFERKVAFTRRVVAAVAAVGFAVVGEGQPRRGECGGQAGAHLGGNGADGGGGRGGHCAYIGRLEGLWQVEQVASRSPRFHGRIEGAAAHCAVAGCGEPGEYKAPVAPADFDGPGTWQWLCLDHVRAHNQSYNFFRGMSTEQIEAAQSPVAGWERPSRTTLHAGGGDPPPAWADFADPIDAIGGRFGKRPAGTGPARAAPGRFTAAELQALAVLGMGSDVELKAVRRRYSQLVRKYHPDRNGGERRHEARLRAVIEAWQVLKVARGFG